jgi:hypothetical protein
VISDGVVALISPPSPRPRPPSQDVVGGVPHPLWDDDVEGTSGAWLFRGVEKMHPGYPNALNGIARPRGGPADGVMHNAGDTRSPFTSWTTNTVTATMFAGPVGAILRINHAPGNGYSQVLSADVHLEAEVLVQGIVTGAEVFQFVARSEQGDLI